MSRNLIAIGRRGGRLRLARAAGRAQRAHPARGEPAAGVPRRRRPRLRAATGGQIIFRYKL